MKLYKCNKCGKEVRIRSNGLCTICAPRRTKRTSTRVRKEKESISSFFDEIKDKVVRISAESGTMIYDFSKRNMCHILPKRHYKSVAENLMNIIPLQWEEHAEFDRLLDRGDKEALMTTFPNVCNLIRCRQEYFKEHVKEEGRILSLILSL